MNEEPDRVPEQHHTHEKRRNKDLYLVATKSSRDAKKNRASRVQALNQKASSQQDEIDGWNAAADVDNGEGVWDGSEPSEPVPANEVVPDESNVSIGEEDLEDDSDSEGFFGKIFGVFD